MHKPFRHSQTSESIRRQIQGEFLELLLQEKAVYPWNPADPEVEGYFANLEQEFCLVDWSESEIETRQETLFSNLQTCLSSSLSNAKVEDSVIEKFGDLMPHDWLTEIAVQSQQAAQINLSRLDQLVQSVKTLLSDWSEEDLQVFARPLAFDMRNLQIEEDKHPLDSSSRNSWDELSSIEQVKQCLEVAQYALAQLEAEQSQQDS